jgi:sulfopyruvate decarboxylase subunit alpha
MIMSHRGTVGEFMSAQIPMGIATPKILDALEIPYFNPKTPDEALKIIPKAWKIAKTQGTPVGLLLDIKFW